MDTTMHEWTDRLSEYLDDELPPAERSALERHLAECAECAAVLADLQAVVARAAALPVRPPARDLWPAIDAEIRPAGAVPGTSRRRTWRERRFSFTLPQLAAAAVAAVVIGGAALWSLAASGGPAAPRQPVAAMEQDPSSVGFVAAFPTEYDDAVAELEEYLRAGRDRLDPATVAVLEENLRVINQAVAESRSALAQDPSNEFLTQYLAESMRRKLRLLRQASEIVRADS
jgi:anti-sigma factor RsiW